MENNTDESKMVIEVSVRNLVEFIMRSGDIDNRQTSGATMDAMAKGTKIHKKIQKMGGNNYFPEVTLKMDFDFQDYKIKLEGFLSRVGKSRRTDSSPKPSLTEPLMSGVRLSRSSR